VSGTVPSCNQRFSSMLVSNRSGPQVEQFTNFQAVGTRAQANTA
jgi:hypothetical protein